jgi:hypothetical protein
MSVEGLDGIIVYAARQGRMISSKMGKKLDVDPSAQMEKM